MHSKVQFPFSKSGFKEWVLSTPYAAIAIRLTVSTCSVVEFKDSLSCWTGIAHRLLRPI